MKQECTDWPRKRCLLLQVRASGTGEGGGWSVGWCSEQFIRSPGEMIPLSRVRWHATIIPATPEGRQDDLSLRSDLSETY